MKKNFKIMMASLLAIPMIALGISAVGQPTYVQALDIIDGPNDVKDPSQGGKLFGSDGAFTKVTNMLLYLIGAISVVMLIYGGIRYTLSGGDSGSVTAAKNTILYALIGIVVSLLAAAIVNFVLTTMLG